MEYIVSLLGRLPRLFETKDEIDPLMKVSRHVVTLQCLGRKRDRPSTIATAYSIG